MADDGILQFLISSGSFNIGFWVIIVVLVLGLIAWLVWMYIKKKVLYVFNFRIIDATGKLTKKKARIVSDDKGVRKFKFEEYKQELDIRDPNCIVDGIPTRVLSWDGQGNLVYTETIDYANLNSNHRFKVAKEEYLKTALKPVEREQVANSIVDAVKKHGETPNALKLAMWFAIALLIIIIVGMFIQGKLLAESYTKNGDALTAMNAFGESNRQTAMIIAENTKIQMIVLEQVLNLSGKSYNITLDTVK